ncbi:MAG: VOC family protein [Mycobacteriales bacterium]
MSVTVGHVEIVGDAAKLQKFYGELFGWEIDADNEWNYGMAMPGGATIGVGPSQDGRPASTIYFAVDDLQAALDKAGKLGGKAVQPPTPIPGMGSFATFADPDGNVIGLFKYEAQ